MSVRRHLENPPVVTVVLTVQFTPALSTLTMLDIAEVFQLYSDRYPVFAQIGRAGPMITDPRQAGGMVEFELGAVLPRVSFGSSDLSRAIYFQEDRMSVNWSRQTGLDEATDYPHYEGLRDNLLDEVSRFLNWSKSKNFPDVAPAVVEVLYQNAFRLDVNGKRRAMSDIFTFFNNPRKAPMSAFNLAWSELTRPSEQSEGDHPITGVINMSTYAGTSPAGMAVVSFQLTGTSTADNTWNTLQRSLDEVHDRIAEIFDGAVQDEILKAKLP